MKTKRKPSKPCETCLGKGYILFTDNTLQRCDACQRFDTAVSAVIAFLQANPLYTVSGIVVERIHIPEHKPLTQP